MLILLRNDVPRNWRTYCDEVTDKLPRAAAPGLTGAGPKREGRALSRSRRNLGDLSGKPCSLACSIIRPCGRHIVQYYCAFRPEATRKAPGATRG
jgi:hypothetical protein